MKRRALNAKDDFSFWSSEMFCKGFKKINDSAKSSLKKWIISRPNIIQYHIRNDYIKVNFDAVIRGVNTELSRKVLLQVSVCKIYTDTQKKHATGFSMEYNKKKVCTY